MFKFTVLFCLLLVGAAVHAEDASAGDEIEANWRLCGDEIKTPIQSEDVKVYISQCKATNGTESRCAMKKNTSVELKIVFKSKMTVPDLERIIVARVPLALTGKHAEMPYGPSISPCTNTSVVATDGTGCVDNGIVEGKTYSYISEFKVLSSFPTISGIEVRIILRQKLDEHKKLRLYRKHPGPMVACVIVPNVEVIE